MGKQKLPEEWKPCIRAIYTGSKGNITQGMLADALGVSKGRVRQICGFYEHRKDPVTGVTALQKFIPTQRKGTEDE